MSIDVKFLIHFKNVVVTEKVMNFEEIEDFKSSAVWVIELSEFTDLP